VFNKDELIALENYRLALTMGEKQVAGSMYSIDTIKKSCQKKHFIHVIAGLLFHNYLPFKNLNGGYTKTLDKKAYKLREITELLNYDKL
jgi:hypothetical protein